MESGPYIYLESTTETSGGGDRKSVAFLKMWVMGWGTIAWVLRDRCYTAALQSPSQCKYTKVAAVVFHKSGHSLVPAE